MIPQPTFIIINSSYSDYDLLFIFLLLFSIRNINIIDITIKRQAKIRDQYSFDSEIFEKSIPRIVMIHEVIIKIGTTYFLIISSVFQI
jgi:hypothetical protein